MRLYWDAHEWHSKMDAQERQKKIAALKVADAINAIGGVPVSDYARDLSVRWARGELSGEEMKKALWAAQQECFGLDNDAPGTIVTCLYIINKFLSKKSKPSNRVVCFFNY